MQWGAVVGGSVTVVKKCRSFHPGRGINSNHDSRFKGQVGCQASLMTASDSAIMGVVWRAYAKVRRAASAQSICHPPEFML
jgi:hypothetical protein